MTIKVQSFELFLPVNTIFKYFSFSSTVTILFNVAEYEVKFETFDIKEFGLFMYWYFAVKRCIEIMRQKWKNIAFWRIINYFKISKAYLHQAVNELSGASTVESNESDDDLIAALM